MRQSLVFSDDATFSETAVSPPITAPEPVNTTPTTQPEGNPPPAALGTLSLGTLPDLLAEATPEALGRAVFATAALHQPDPGGRCGVCAVCRPRRFGWWRRGHGSACPTLSVLFWAVGEPPHPRFTPA